MKVLELTTEQRDDLIGQRYDGIQYFNPIQDGNGTWIISIEERDCCNNQSVIDMVNNLPEIDFIQPEYEI